MNIRTGAVPIFAAVLVILGLIVRLPGVTGRGAGLITARAATQSATPGLTPVLVELFTSEGCSSCPPADALLMRLWRKQPIPGADIIVLEEHVNYWDQLGWKDPFSSDAATARQVEYGQAFGGQQIYTPQMVVDGYAEFVGSAEGTALRAVGAASASAKPSIHLSWIDGDTLAIHVQPLTNAAKGDTPQVSLAIAENMLHSDVKRGENEGRTLVHDGVIRQLIEVGKADADPAGFSSTIAVHVGQEWNRTNLRAVVFVQERHSRHVLTAAAISFPAA
jgi:hypothetical protein